MEHLYDKLRVYSEGEDYPYHMPGHKRRAVGDMSSEIYRLDITEIDGFDNLHAPEGVIEEIQRQASRLYGAQESFLLVGGSTCGILTAISAALPLGGHLLMARNCHKSVYHGAYLRQLQISYLYPEIDPESGICEPIKVGQITEALDREPDVAAVLIVSPTYEGRIADVAEIAKVVHERNKILIVDEAHGAHLGLAEGFAKNSCQAGADLVIHSVHKTLPAMTQTAILHRNGNRVNRDKIARFLHIYQSSSPSYVLMASIDNALQMVERDGAELFGEFALQYRQMVDTLKACKHLRFPLEEMAVDKARQDVGKLVIHSGNSGLSGQQLYDILRLEYHLQPEMAAGEYCLAMFTVGDTPEGYERMEQALLEIDRRVEAGEIKGSEKRCSEDAGAPEAGKIICSDAEKVIPFAGAWDMETEEVPLEQCVGRYAGEFVNLYPPGTPILVPGEVFTRELTQQLKEYHDLGLNLQGVGEDLYVKCLK